MQASPGSIQAEPSWYLSAQQPEEEAAAAEEWSPLLSNVSGLLWQHGAKCKCAVAFSSACKKSPRHEGTDPGVGPEPLTPAEFEMWQQLLSLKEWGLGHRLDEPGFCDSPLFCISVAS